MCVETLRDLIDSTPAHTSRFAFMYAKTVTLGGTHWQRTNEILFRNRRIGCRHAAANCLSGLSVEFARSSRWRPERDRVVAFLVDVDLHAGAGLMFARSLHSDCSVVVGVGGGPFHCPWHVVDVTASTMKVPRFPVS